MNADVFAEWLCRQGHQVVRTASSYWFDAAPRVLQAFPYHWLIEPGEDELREALAHGGAIALRYSAPLDHPAGKLSYHTVFKGPTYDMHRLSKGARADVRAALRQCSVAPIALSRLAAEGWALEADTIERQGREASMTQASWQKRCLAAEGLPGFEAWGALVNGRLAASALTCAIDDCCYILHQQSRQEYLRLHVNHALAYTLTQTFISRPGVRAVHYGVHSLDAPASVDAFKSHLGYTAQPLRQRVAFCPWFAPLVGQASFDLVHRLYRLWPKSQWLAKAEGMIRFYLEGRRPLGEQNVPALLAPILQRGGDWDGQAKF